MYSSWYVGMVVDSRARLILLCINAQQLFEFAQPKTTNTNKIEQIETGMRLACTAHMASQILFLIKRTVQDNSVWAMLGLNELLQKSNPLRVATAARLENQIRSSYSRIPKAAIKVLKDGASFSSLSLYEQKSLKVFDDRLRTHTPSLRTCITT